MCWEPLSGPPCHRGAPNGSPFTTEEPLSGPPCHTREPLSGPPLTTEEPLSGPSCHRRAPLGSLRWCTLPLSHHTITWLDISWSEMLVNLKKRAPSCLTKVTLAMHLDISHEVYSDISFGVLMSFHLCWDPCQRSKVLCCSHWKILRPIHVQLYTRIYGTISAHHSLFFLTFVHTSVSSTSNWTANHC